MIIYKIRNLWNFENFLFFEIESFPIIDDSRNRKFWEILGTFQIGNFQNHKNNFF